MHKPPKPAAFDATELWLNSEPPSGRLISLLDVSRGWEQARTRASKRNELGTVEGGVPALSEFKYLGSVDNDKRSVAIFGGESQRRYTLR